jgi:hypothetical protein
MSDDKSGSRGQGGSPSDLGGLVGPQGSAPASSRENLIRRLEFALDLFRNDEEKAWWQNIALMDVEGAIQTWRAETWPERPPGPLRGRPPVVDRDAQTLLDLRAANPDSDCREIFEKRTGAEKQQARIRYQNANALVAELNALMASSSGKPS